MCYRKKVSASKNPNHSSTARTPLAGLRGPRAAPRDAAVFFRAYHGAVDREHFLVAMLDQKNKVIGINTVSMGSLTASVVHPREVFKPAILSNAAALLCCHNHPSGAPQPSQEDRALTTRLVDVGRLLGIALLDHIILGDGNETYYSFADEQML
jgi:DNA repair protein RadC